MTGDELERSWGTFTDERADRFLESEDAPSGSSKELTLDVIRSRFGSKPSILDLGCGNAHLYDYFREAQLDFSYTGVDFSKPLLASARRRLSGRPDAELVEADVNTLAGVEGSWDVALYSHVVEMLASPEASMLAARRLCRAIVVRFFEPPLAENDHVEIRHLDVGRNEQVPYLRRRMSRDYYRLILHKLGCRQVDVYQDEASKDQVHVLVYEGTWPAS